MDLLLSALVPLALFAAFVCFAQSVKFEGEKGAAEKKKLTGAFIKIFVCEWCFFILAGCFARYCTFSDGNGVHPVAVALAGAAPYLTVLARKFVKDERAGRFMKKAAVALFAVFAAELLLFNAKSFDTQNKSAEYDSQSLGCDGDVFIEEGDLVVRGGSLYLREVPDYARAVVVDIERDDADEAEPFTVTLGVMDDNVTNNYETARTRNIAKREGEFSLSFTPYGKTRGLRVAFSDINRPVRVKSVRVTSAPPFRFFLVRFLVLSGIALLLLAVYTFRLHMIKFRSDNAVHLFLVGTMVALCVFSSIVFIPKQKKPYEFDHENVSVADPFAAQLDAFEKGQLWLDVEAEPGLAEIDNVYSRTERDETGLFYNWDTAYYKGKYYCYFGVAPVITYYLPYYKLTGKYPTETMALDFFGPLAIFSLCMAILSAVKLLCPRPNLLLLLGLLPASVACSGIYYCMDMSCKYTVPLLSGLFFMYFTLWMGLGACASKKKRKRIAMLILGGASLACCVASRPGMSLGAAVLVPFFIGILRNKDMKLGFRLAQAAAFVVPLLAGGCAIMWYNNARFGSPFEFGAAYQLTVSDIGANKVSLAGLPPMLMQYFAQGTHPTATFPFIESEFFGYFNYGKYVFYADAMGVFGYPMLLMGVLLAPAAIQRKGKRFAYGASKASRNAFIVLCFATAVFIGWQDFCLGGVHNRYIIDVLPLMIVGGGICLLRGAGSAKKHGYRHAIVHLGMLASFYIGWAITIAFRDGTMYRRFPELHDVLEDTIVFWI